MRGRDGTCFLITFADIQVPFTFRFSLAIFSKDYFSFGEGNFISLFNASLSKFLRLTVYRILGKGIIWINIQKGTVADCRMKN